jgi:arylsulfatase A-like enzyme
MQSGARLDRFYANSSVCSPTRAALLTGCYPELVGVPGVIRTHAEENWGYLAGNAILLPEVLGKAGYDTAIVGKWHLGLAAPNRPIDRGFGHFHGFLGDMMDDYVHHRRHGNLYMRLNDREIDPVGHATALFTTWACDYLRTRKNGRPFFLYLAYNAPHAPLQPPDDWYDKVRQRQPDMDPGRAKLVALIEHLDDGIGRVMETLKETGLDGKTLVVFTSDNGGQRNLGSSNGRLRDGKGSMYEGGLRVPTCIVWPGRIAAGHRLDAVALTMDLFPTLCEAADAAWHHAIDGRSLLPELLGRTSGSAERDVFFHRREGWRQYGGLAIRAVRRGDWKLVQNNPFAPLELFDLKMDPYEQQDLASREPEKVNELLGSLRLHIQRGGAVPWQAP